jgi:hypothetical protein
MVSKFFSLNISSFGVYACIVFDVLFETSRCTSMEINITLLETKLSSHDVIKAQFTNKLREHDF